MAGSRRFAADEGAARAGAYMMSRPRRGARPSMGLRFRRMQLLRLIGSLALLAAWVVACKSSSSAGDACTSAGGTCVLGPGLDCGKQAQSSSQDCNASETPGGQVCCLAPGDAGLALCQTDAQCAAQVGGEGTCCAPWDPSQCGFKIVGGVCNGCCRGDACGFPPGPDGCHGVLPCPDGSAGAICEPVDAGSDGAIDDGGGSCGAYSQSDPKCATAFPDAGIPNMYACSSISVTPGATCQRYYQEYWCCA